MFRQKSAVRPKMIYYAIGDIHGELEKLKALHETITDYHKTVRPGYAQTRVHLGDYVDRGPDSAGVIDYILTLQQQADFDVISLKGNHEHMMLGAFDGDDENYGFWLRNGGSATMKSYIKRGLGIPPKTHMDWLRALPARFTSPDGDLVFVHAGINPEQFPSEPDSVYLWTRSLDFFESEHWVNPALDDALVVHGHTPTQAHRPEMSKDGRRINVDTGAVYGGQLSCAVIEPNQEVSFLSV